jgi:hypothetical protein
MNQRRQPRLAVNQSVAITLFGEPDFSLSGRIRNLSGKGIGLEFEEFVAAGTALRIELEDALLFGEVIFYRKDGDTYYAGVELEQALSGLGELSRILLAFQEGMAPEGSGAEQHDALVDASQQGKQQSH